MCFLYDKSKFEVIENISALRCGKDKIQPSKVEIKYHVNNKEFVFLEIMLYMDNSEQYNILNKYYDIPDKEQAIIVFRAKDKVITATQKFLFPFTNTNQIWNIKTKEGRRVFLDLAAYDLKEIRQIVDLEEN